MMKEEKCIPWYFPPVNTDVWLCSPFEARRFKKEVESMAADECKVTLVFYCKAELA